MNTFTTFVKTHAWKLIAIFFFLVAMSNGCTNKRIAKLEKQYEEKTASLDTKLDSINTKTKLLPTSKSVKDDMERVMLDFLIYEDDLDKKNTSISEIKKSNRSE